MAFMMPSTSHLLSNCDYISVSAQSHNSTGSASTPILRSYSDGKKLRVDWFESILGNGQMATWSGSLPFNMLTEAYRNSDGVLGFSLISLSFARKTFWDVTS
ncbi:hypothetical protein AMECASPLE_000814 [Ameca splendens]|uniref:Uncharacterized protein n=1 Tax=Ameca splendens TaxID=208324 RepID=A0ABV1A457_9TELE